LPRLVGETSLFSCCRARARATRRSRKYAGDRLSTGPQPKDNRYVDDYLLKS
jgi:hypothetical protein